MNAAEFPFTVYSFTVTATSTSTVLSFSGREVPAEYGLDNVSVTQNVIPEPASLSLLGISSKGARGLHPVPAAGEESPALGGRVIWLGGRAHADGSQPPGARALRAMMVAGWRPNQKEGATRRARGKARMGHCHQTCRDRRVPDSDARPRFVTKLTSVGGLGKSRSHKQWQGGSRGGLGSRGDVGGRASAGPSREGAQALPRAPSTSAAPKDGISRGTRAQGQNIKSYLGVACRRPDHEKETDGAPWQGELPSGAWQIGGAFECAPSPFAEKTSIVPRPSVTMHSGYRSSL